MADRRGPRARGVQSVSGRTPDSAYVIRSDVFGEPRIEVGQRVVHTQREWPSVGLVIGSRPTALSPYGSSRIFRVSDIQGLEGRSFTPGWKDTGYCKSYFVEEELPLASAFGPRGVEVLEIVERVERMSGTEIVALGELSIRRGGFSPDHTHHVGWEVVATTGLQYAMHEAGRRIVDAILARALETSDPTLVDEFDGCVRTIEIVHPTWKAAQSAAYNAMCATLCADALDPATFDAMTGTWRTFLGADLPG